MKKYVRVISFLFVGLGSPMAFAGSCSLSEADRATLNLNNSTAQNVKVAFIGDTGFSEDAKKVFRMIKREAAEIVVHQGDLIYDYPEDQVDRRENLEELGNKYSKMWEEMINKILGPDFPYVASIGNHDQFAWDTSLGVKQYLNKRVARIPGLKCVGNHGINSVCTFKGLYILLTALGTYQMNDSSYLKGNIGCGNFKWRVCSWHKNMTKMQLGKKNDDVGWDAYEACRKEGAIIASGHEHSYSRTWLMSDFENQVVAEKNPTLKLSKGKSFAFVNGLGGQSSRVQLRDGHWWAVKYTKTNNARPGVVFCEFKTGAGKQPPHSDCYFKNIDGVVIDRFRLESHLP